MKVDVMETCVVEKDLIDILQEYKNDSELAEGICTPDLKRSLGTILHNDRIRRQLLEMLKFKPFQGIITASSLRSFAGLLKAGAEEHLSNAFCRVLEFWRECPPSSSLVNLLEGRWGCEITADIYSRWSNTTSEDYPKQLLDKIRNQSCRIITLRTVIAESRAFHFFFKSTPTPTLDDFLRKVSEYTSDDPNAPQWTRLRQVSRPRNGIWSHMPHESIKDVYPITEDSLTSGGNLSIKALFQDFVMVFFGPSAYSNLGHSQDKTAVGNYTKILEDMEKSIPLKRTNELMKRHGILYVKDMKDVIAASQHPEGGLYRLDCVSRSPPISIQVGHESQRASLVDVDHSYSIPENTGAAPQTGLDISTGSFSDSESMYSGEAVMGPYVEEFEAKDIKGRIDDTDHVVLESNLPVDRSNVLSAISSPTASKMAASFQADAGLPYIYNRDFRDSDATLVPDKGGLGLDDMVFTNVRYRQDKSPTRLFLVPADVTEPSEIVKMVQERYHQAIAPKLSNYDMEVSKREAAIALYGKSRTPVDKNTARSKVRLWGMLPRILQSSRLAKASTGTGPFYIRST